MREVKTILEYNQILDAMKIITRKENASLRWMAEWTCENMPHIIFECGWEESIIYENPSNQMLGSDICGWAEELLGFRYETLTNNWLGYDGLIGEG